VSEKEREREGQGVAITSEKLIPPRVRLSDDAERPSHIDPTIRASRVRVQTPLAAFATSCLPNSCKYVWIVRDGRERERGEKRAFLYAINIHELQPLRLSSSFCPSSVSNVPLQDFLRRLCAFRETLARPQREMNRNSRKENRSEK